MVRAFCVDVCVCLLIALFLDEEYKGDSLECEVGNIADAESQDEVAGFGDMGECPGADDYKVQKECADGDPEEVLDEVARVFVKALYHCIVLQAGDYGKVKRDERHNGLEHALGEPEGAESGQDEHDGQKDEGDVVFFHDIVFYCMRLSECLNELMLEWLARSNY